MWEKKKRALALAVSLGISVPAAAQNSGSWMADADGSWSIGSNWSSDPSFPDGGGTATFNLVSGSSSTLNISLDLTNVSLAAITFDSPTRYAILPSGAVPDASITLVGPAVINAVLNSGSFTSGHVIGVPLGGSGGLSKVGGDSLILGTLNTYTGATMIGEGTLQLAGGNDRLPVGTAVALSGSATLDLNGNDQTVASLAGTSTNGVALGSGILTVNTTGSATFAGVISGGTLSGLVKQGSGMLSLTGSNTYSGTTWITAGALEINSVANDGLAGALGASDDTPARVDQPNAPLPHLILDGGTLRYTGSGHSTNRHFALGPNGGTIDASGSGSLNISNWWAVVSYGADGSRTLTLTGDNSSANTFGLVIFDYDFGTPGGGIAGFGESTALTKTGIGKWVIPATVPNQPFGVAFRNQYTGPTQILGGVLEIQAQTIGNGVLSGGLAIGGVASAIGKSSAAANNLIIDGGTFRYVYLSPHSQAGHDAGQIDRLFSIGLGGATIDSSGNGPLNLFNSGAIGLVGSGPRTLTLAGDFADTVDGTNQYTAINGVIGDNGGPTSVVKSGPGEWVLTGVNTYSGSTTINDGILLLAHGNNHLPVTTAVSIGPTGQLQLFTGDSAFPSELISQTIASLSGTGSVRLNAGSLNINSSIDTTYAGTIFDTVLDSDISKETGGQISKAGSGILTLTGSNCYTGPTKINAGILRIGHGAALGSTVSGTTVAASAVLELLAGAKSAESVTINGSGPAGAGAIHALSGASSLGAVTLNSSAAVAADAGASLSLGAVSGSGSAQLTMLGAGTISATSYRAGTLTVSAGIARVQDGGGSLGTSRVTALAIASGASMDLRNHDLIVDYPSNASPTPTDSIRQMLIDGRLTTSLSDATHGLGYAENTVLGLPRFSGIDVDATSVLVKYTFLGDSNLDGQVDIKDLLALASNFNSSGAVWTGGDFNYDGVVNSSDLGIIASNWQAGVGSPLGPGSFAEALVSVPEPVALGMIAFALPFLRRRRNSGTRQSV